jgi:hypothetical protein
MIGAIVPCYDRRNGATKQVVDFIVGFKKRSRTM